MKNIVYTSFILLTAVLWSSCSESQNEMQEETTTADVVTATPTDAETTASEDKEKEAYYISVRGYIDVPPESRASISPFYGGYVNKINVLPGTQVKKGEVLFTLQNPYYLEIQQQYLEASEQINYLKEDFERQKVLSSEEISSKKSYAKAEAAYKTTMAKVTGLKEQLKLLGLSTDSIEKGHMQSTVAVYAPISGSVTEVNIQKGAFLDPKDVAMKVVNTDHLHLELEVFEKNAKDIKKGQEILFTVPELSSQEYVGEVHLIVPAIDMQKRTFMVHGHIEDEKKADFLPGMYVDAKIVQQN